MIDAEEAKRLVASYMAKGLIIPPPKLKKELEAIKNAK